MKLPAGRVICKKIEFIESKVRVHRNRVRKKSRSGVMSENVASGPSFRRGNSFFGHISDYESNCTSGEKQYSTVPKLNGGGCLWSPIYLEFFLGKVQQLNNSKTACLLAIGKGSPGKCSLSIILPWTAGKGGLWNRYAYCTRSSTHLMTF